MIVGAHGNASGGQTFRRRSVEWVRCRLRSIPASVFPGLNSCVLCSHRFPPVSSNCGSFLDTPLFIYRLLQHENSMHSRRDSPPPDSQCMTIRSDTFTILVWPSSSQRPTSVCVLLFPRLIFPQVFTGLISSSYTSFPTTGLAASGAGAVQALRPPSNRVCSTRQAYRTNLSTTPRTRLRVRHRALRLGDIPPGHARRS